MSEQSWDAKLLGSHSQFVTGVKQRAHTKYILPQEQISNLYPADHIII